MYISFKSFVLCYEISTVLVYKHIQQVVDKRVINFCKVKRKPLYIKCWRSTPVKNYIYFYKTVLYIRNRL